MAENEQIQDKDKELETLKAKVDEEAKAKKQFETDLDGIYKDLLQEVPEQHRDMIPNNLSLGERIKWVRSALKKGLFSKETKNQVQVDQSRPKTTPQNQVNLDGLKPEALMAMGYKT